MGVKRVVTAALFVAGALLSTVRADAATVDCRSNPHQIGDFLARFKLTPASAPSQAMTVDVLRISASAAPRTTLGWLYLDQYGNRWLQAVAPSRLRFNGTIPTFQAALRVTGAAQYMPAPITFSVPDMALERCDRVSAP
jgi:hypothetical protein